MKNKKFVIFLALLITFFCAYFLSFTYKSWKLDEARDRYVENRLLAFEGDSLPRATLDSLKSSFKKDYRDSLWNQNVFSFLGMADYTYREVKNNELKLGLDLQGGMHVTMEISPEGILSSLSDNNEDPVFLGAIEKAKERQQTEARPFVDLFYEAWRESMPEGRLAEAFLTADNQDEITLKTTDEEILDIVRRELDDAIERSVVVFRSRLNPYGASQVTIRTIKSTGRIEIELPGEEDRQSVKEQLESVAQLEFLKVYNNDRAILPGLMEINRLLVKENGAKAPVVPDSGAAPAEPTAPAEVPASDGLFADAPVDTASAAADTTALALDTPGVQTPAVAGVDSMPLFQLIFTTPGARTQEEVYVEYKLSENKTIYDAPLYGDIARRDELEAILARPEVKALLPENCTLLWGLGEADQKGQQSRIVPVYFVYKSQSNPAQLTGESITDARADQNQLGRMAVMMTMDTEGAAEWARMTGEVASDPDIFRIAVALDNVVYSAPTVSQAITGGRSEISGSFSLEEAKLLASVIKAGKMPAPAKVDRIVEIGPTLGKESIGRGLTSMVIGLLLVIVFMVIYYAKAGLVANVALLVNLFFIIGVMAQPALGTALTLEGIAGIVLTIGMAIDANVLIFERIREELREGASLQAAIRGGYNRAFLTIIDSNLTTLITAFILATFGTGLVKGFAVALIVGIACSFFTAVFVSRLIIEWLARKGDQSSISFETGFSRRLFRGTKPINFVGNRKIAYVISSLVIAGGIGVIATQGLNLGVSFKGGYSYVVKFDEPVSSLQARGSLNQALGGASMQIKTFNGPDQLMITTSYLVESTEENADSLVRVAVLGGLNKDYADLNPTVIQSISVNPTIAADIKQTALTSLLISLVAIFFYVVLRFRRWQFGLGALIALFHDVLVVLSVFAIAGLAGFSFEIDEVFVAAMLTIIGYSINDTVVVFDRVREFIKNRFTVDMKETINNSINATLSRTVMTSFTTLIVIGVLVIYGGEALRGFSLALLVGIIVGTYSSIFVATPLVLDTTPKKRQKKAKKA